MAKRKEPDVVRSITESVRKYIRTHEMVLGGESILLGVSGGVDSIVLLDVINRVAGPLGITVGVAHFNHKLRPTSEEDADFVRERARALRLKPYVASGDIKQIVEEGGGSIEEVARRERYAFLERIARRHKFSVVMTGHTADDNAETVMMNLMRGSGVTGLSGIPPSRWLGEDVILARPMLGLTRLEVEEYAEKRGLEWREDESNSSHDFTRNRIRAELMPLLRTFNPGILDVLNTTAGLMRNVDRYLSGVVDSAVENALAAEIKREERSALDVTTLRHLHPAVRSEVVQRVISNTFAIPPVSSKTVDRVLGLMWKETGARASLGGRHEALRDRGSIVFYRKPIVVREVDKEFVPGEEVEAGDFLLTTSFIKGRPKFSSDTSIEFVNADEISGKLTLRSWREGDVFCPLGMKGKEKKLSDFLIDEKIPLDRKAEVLVVADGEKIVWICGMRVDERYRVVKDTARVMKLEFVR